MLWMPASASSMPLQLAWNRVPAHTWCSCVHAGTTACYPCCTHAQARITCWDMHARHLHILLPVRVLCTLHVLHTSGDHFNEATSPLQDRDSSQRLCPATTVRPALTPGVRCSARLGDLRGKLEAAQAEHDRLAGQVDKLRGDVRSALSLLDGLKKQAQPDQQ